MPTFMFFFWGGFSGEVTVTIDGYAKAQAKAVYLPGAKAQAVFIPGRKQ